MSASLCRAALLIAAIAITTISCSPSSDAKQPDNLISREAATETALEALHEGYPSAFETDSPNNVVAKLITYNEVVENEPRLAADILVAEESYVWAVQFEGEYNLSQNVLSTRGAPYNYAVAIVNAETNSPLSMSVGRKPFFE